MSRFMKDIEIFNDHFQNYKVYGIPKAQLVIADIPYNIGANAYGSNPMWYVNGDNKNGESEPCKNSLIKLSNNDIKSRTPYYQYIEEIAWSDRFGCYTMKLNPEGQAKWEQERKEMVDFFSKYGTV